jgi:beta-lactamase class A
MRTPSNLRALDAELRSQPGVSVWCAPLGASDPAYALNERQTHYAASTMKIALLAALFRAYDEGWLDIDEPVPVINEFASARPGAPRFSQRRDDDNDTQTWDLIGRRASLRWLAWRMITVSGNLAANIVLSHVGVAAVEAEMRRADASDGRVQRGIADLAARDAGIDNQVSARDLAMLLSSVATGPRAGEMLEMLFAQQRREDLATGLPGSANVAHKNGFVTGVRHGAGIVYADDAPPYTIVVCSTAADRSDYDACELIARVATASWDDRHHLDRRS